ncbi:hypothetical protein MBLNU459_g2459t2 [Dothideomycetes sp. NU459]
MEPASILAIISACINITVKAATIGKDAAAVYETIKEAPRDVRLLLVRVTAVGAAVKYISDWLSKIPKNRLSEYEEIVEQLGFTLGSCDEALAILGASLSKVKQEKLAEDGKGTGDKQWKKRIAYWWNESSMKEHEDNLARHIEALQLLLQCLMLPNFQDRRSLLETPETQSVLSSVYDSHCSLYLQPGNDSRTSFLTDCGRNADRISTLSELDEALLATKVYGKVIPWTARELPHDSPTGNAFEYFDFGSLQNTLPDFDTRSDVASHVDDDGESVGSDWNSVDTELTAQPDVPSQPIDMTEESDDSPVEDEDEDEEVHMCKGCNEVS